MGRNYKARNYTHRYAVFPPKPFILKTSNTFIITKIIKPTGNIHSTENKKEQVSYTQFQPKALHEVWNARSGMLLPPHLEEMLGGGRD